MRAVAGAPLRKLFKGISVAARLVLLELGSRLLNRTTFYLQPSGQHHRRDCVSE